MGCVPQKFAFPLRNPHKAKLCMVYEPNPGEGFEFENSVVGGAVPKEYVPAVVKGTEGHWVPLWPFFLGRSIQR
jgi:hypothetical protein